MTTRRIASLPAALAVLLACLAGCGGSAVVPSSYTTYNAKDGSFQIELPAEWEIEGGGRGSYAWAKATSGGAVIRVETSVAGSLMGDIAASQNAMLGDEVPDEETAPVHEVHLVEQEAFTEEKGCQEEDPVAIKTGMGDSRRSEFSGSGTFGGALRGYRVTALGRDLRIRVVCMCPESQWAELQPAFDHAIESLAHGKPER